MRKDKAKVSVQAKTAPLAKSGQAHVVPLAAKAALPSPPAPAAKAHLAEPPAVAAPAPLPPPLPFAAKAPPHALPPAPDPDPAVPAVPRGNEPRLLEVLGKAALYEFAERGVAKGYRIVCGRHRDDDDGPEKSA